MCQYCILRFVNLYTNHKNGVTMLYKRIRDLREDKDLTQKEVVSFPVGVDVPGDPKNVRNRQLFFCI